METFNELNIKIKAVCDDCGSTLKVERYPKQNFGWISCPVCEYTIQVSVEFEKK